MNTHHITRKSHLRLRGYDYTQANYYFITVCTENQKDWFGIVEDGEITLNRYGRICHEHLTGIPHRYNECTIDTYVIMPNHVHGIFLLLNNVADPCIHNGQGLALSLHNTVRKRHVLISSIIRDFKSFVSREINKLIYLGGAFKWQRSFYDHSIRSENELRFIRGYIKINPLCEQKEVL